MSAYHFVESKYCRPQGGTRVEYLLQIRQQPKIAKACTTKEKERRPVDPPPIVQIRLKDERQDPCQNYLQSPHLFLCADLCYPADNNPPSQNPNTVNNALAGTSVSSLYRLKDQDNSEAGFFVFGDLSVKLEGTFRLRFYLFEVRQENVHFLQTIESDIFKVVNSKDFPGLGDSTFLSRSFADQGVKIKIRKVRRIQMKRSPLRPTPTAERVSQYGVSDPRTAGGQYPVASRPTQYDDRANPEYHYSGAPIRHVARPVEYHPYNSRSHFPSGTYQERPAFTEMVPGNYMGGAYSGYVAGSPPSDYIGYPKSMAAPHHPASEYYYPDNRGGMTVQHVPLSHGEYEERREGVSYPEVPLRQHPVDQRSYASSYPPPRSQYPQDQRPLSAYSPSHLQHNQEPLPPGRQSTPPQPVQGSPRYREAASTPAYYSRFRSEDSPHHNSPAYHPSPQNRTPSNIHDGMGDEAHRRTSPISGGSDISSMGRSTPVARETQSSRGSADDQGLLTQGGPVRNGTSVEVEQVPPKSNSNLWQLVSVATDDE